MIPVKSFSCLINPSLVCSLLIYCSCLTVSRKLMLLLNEFKAITAFLIFIVYLNKIYIIKFIIAPYGLNRYFYAAANIIANSVYFS